MAELIKAPPLDIKYFRLRRVLSAKVIVEVPIDFLRFFLKTTRYLSIKCLILRVFKQCLKAN